MGTSSPVVSRDVGATAGSMLPPFTWPLSLSIISRPVRRSTRALAVAFSKTSTTNEMVSTDLVAHRTNFKRTLNIVLDAAPSVVMMFDENLNRLARSFSLLLRFLFR